MSNSSKNLIPPAPQTGWPIGPLHDADLHVAWVLGQVREHVLDPLRAALGLDHGQEDLSANVRRPHQVPVLKVDRADAVAVLRHGNGYAALLFLEAPGAKKLVA